MCVVWWCRCKCKSMPSYFLIPSIAVLFCYWHQTYTTSHAPALLSISQTSSTDKTTAAATSEVTTAASRPARRHLPRVERRPSSRVRGSILGRAGSRCCGVRSPGQLLSDNQLRFLNMNNGK